MPNADFQIFNHAPDGILVVNKNGIITRANPKVEEIFQYKKEELISQRVEILVPDEFKKKHPSQVKSFFDNPGPRGMGSGLNISGQRKDGSLIAVDIALSPLGDDVMAIIRDVSLERKNTEELKRSNDELSQFAYIASHDLQEPLRKIRSFLTLLFEGIKTNLTEEEVLYINKIDNSADRMQTLINDLLTFSRVRTNQESFKLESLNDLLLEVIDIFELKIRECDASLDIGSLPDIMVDGKQIKQLFQNLIGNALNYRKKDEAPRIKIFASLENKSQNQNVEIHFQDNCIGFEQKYADKIFDVFKRLHKRNEYEGTGIGLAICKKIVERHNGSLRVVSELGKGSDFIITLPLKQMQI